MNTQTFCKWSLMPLLLIAACSNAADPAGKHCTPRFENGWVRMGPAAMPMMGGFGRIANHCPTAAVFVGASSDQFSQVSLHRTRVEDGVSRMRAVPTLEVGAGKSAVLEPGGLHLMLAQPDAPLIEGSEVVVTLALADGRKVEAQLVVRKNAR